MNDLLHIPMERIPDIYITKKFRIKINYKQRRFIDEQLALCNQVKRYSIQMIYQFLSDLINRSIKGDKEAGYLLGSVKHGKKTLFRQFYNEIYSILQNQKDQYGITNIYHEALTSTILSVCNAFAVVFLKEGKIPKFDQLPYFHSLKAIDQIPPVKQFSINTGRKDGKERRYLRHNLIKAERMQYIRLFNSNANYFTLEEWMHCYGLSVKREIDGKYYLLVKMRFPGEYPNELWDGPPIGFYRKQFLDQSKIYIPTQDTIFSQRMNDDSFRIETPRVKDYQRFVKLRDEINQIRRGSTFIITANHFWAQSCGVTIHPNQMLKIDGSTIKNASIPQNFNVEQDPILKRKIDEAYAYKRHTFFIASTLQKKMDKKDVYHTPKLRRAFKRYHTLWNRVIHYKKHLIHNAVHYILRFLPLYIVSGFFRKHIPFPSLTKKKIGYDKWIRHYMNWRYKVESNALCTELISTLQAKARMLGIASFKVDTETFDYYTGRKLYASTKSGNQEFSIKIAHDAEDHSLHEYIDIDHEKISIAPLICDCIHTETLKTFHALVNRNRPIQNGDVIKPNFYSWYPICNTLLHQPNQSKELDKIPPEYHKAFGYFTADDYVIKNALNRILCGLPNPEPGYRDPSYHL